jgi:hypothetical protein
MADESFDPGAHVGQTVTFRGTAMTGAAGAIVMAASEPVYVDGLEAWTEEAEGRAVEVSGVLRLRESGMPAPDPDGLPLHGIDEDTYVLDDAKWALIDG